MKVNVFGEGNGERAGAKQGGVKKGDHIGGIYNGVDNGQGQKVSALIKKDEEVSANISEFLGAAIFQATAPKYGAKVFLTVQHPTDLPSKTGREVYVGSELVKNSEDMFKDMRQHMAPNTGFSESALLDAADDRPRFAGTRGGHKIYEEAFKQRGYTGFNETMPTSLLLNDMDVHSGNFRVQYLDANGNPAMIIEQGKARNMTEADVAADMKKPFEQRLIKETRLVRMDYGGGLKVLDPSIHPNSESRHLPGVGPTNHFIEYPNSLKLNHEFADSLLATAKVDIKPQIKQSFEELAKYYDPIALAKWAQRAMPDKFDKQKPENIKLEQVQEAFIERMVERQSSLKEYGLQIKLGLLIEQDKSKGKPSHPYKFKDQSSQKEFAKLVKEYPEYFEKINDNPKLFKFRDKTLGKNALKFMQEQIKTAVVVGIFPSKGELIGGKDGGAKESDPYGGKYKKDNDVYLVKRDFKKSQNDIAEYLASSIFKEIAADHCPEVTLVKNESPKDPNKNSFIASKFFSSSEGYKDFHKEFGDEQRRTSGETTDYILGKEQRVKTALLNRSDDGSYKYEGYEQSVVTSLLVGDFSVHSGNLGVVNGKDESHKKLVRIDFGAAFRDFSSDINPYKSITSSLGQEKNYLLRDHPKERIMTKQFADELRRAASVPLEVLVEKQWDTIKDNFTPEAVQAFAKQIRVPGAKKGVEVSDEVIKKHFKETMQKRQQSLKNMACEIDIYRAMDTVGTKKEREAAIRVAVKNAVAESPDYFTDPSKLNKKSQLKVQYTKEVRRILKEEIALAPKKQTQTLSSPVIATTKSRDAIVLAEQSEVSVLGKDGGKVGTIKPQEVNQSALKQPLASSGKLQSVTIDPLSLIRQEVISKQAEILKNAAASIHPEIDKLSPKEFKEYLEKPGNKQKVEQAFENSKVKEDLEKAIQKAEIAGYKKFNEEFAKTAKAVEWDSPSSKPNEKLQIVKNKAREELCTLVEKTVNLSRTTTLLDGSTKKQEVSARTIEFPTSIKEGSGPMHASFALKDEHGQNMPAEGAVYFTAHYDKSGKLTEVSSPQPVKFMGSNPETAVGYIERNGQIYTLPVTQKTYENMMKQTVDLAKQEDLAKDHVIVTAIESPVKAKPSYSLEEVSEKLKGKTSKQVVEILKNKVVKGNEELVDLIVKATEQNKADGVLPTLTAKQYKEVYDYGMHKAAPAAQNLVSQKSMHEACNKLVEPAKIDPKYHAHLVTFNTGQLNKEVQSR